MLKIKPVNIGRCFGMAFPLTLHRIMCRLLSEALYGGNDSRGSGGMGKTDVSFFSLFIKRLTKTEWNYKLIIQEFLWLIWLKLVGVYNFYLNHVIFIFSAISIGSIS
jgi:hypothetical protein